MPAPTYPWQLSGRGTEQQILSTMLMQPRYLPYNQVQPVVPDWLPTYGISPLPSGSYPGAMGSVLREGDSTRAASAAGKIRSFAKRLGAQPGSVMRRESVRGASITFTGSAQQARSVKRYAVGIGRHHDLTASLQNLGMGSWKIMLSPFLGAGGGRALVSGLNDPSGDTPDVSGGSAGNGSGIRRDPPYAAAAVVGLVLGALVGKRVGSPGVGAAAGAVLASAGVGLFAKPSEDIPLHDAAVQELSAGQGSNLFDILVSGPSLFLAGLNVSSPTIRALLAGAGIVLVARSVRSYCKTEQIKKAVQAQAG